MESGSWQWEGIVCWLETSRLIESNFGMILSIRSCTRTKPDEAEAVVFNLLFFYSITPVAETGLLIFALFALSGSNDVRWHKDVIFRGCID
jgi:hypothetical protein